MLNSIIGFGARQKSLHYRLETTMPYDLADRLVVGVASSALFDLTESDKFFRDNGEMKYRTYQDERIDETLTPGVAFPFVKRLLGLDDLRPYDPLVEVIVLSKNDPTTGLRVMRSVAAHELEVTRAIFTQGASPYEYIEALEMSLFLSANRADVDAALKAGHPAGHVLASTALYNDDDQSLRIAFDFDGVLASDESEKIYQSGDLGTYMDHESIHRADALQEGLLKPLLADLNRIQALEEERSRADQGYEARLRIALVTARNAPAHERAVNSLRKWGVEVNDAFFLGGIAKSRILQVMRPHLFFDDQELHLTGAAQYAAGVHIPYGVANEKTPRKPKPDFAFNPLPGISLGESDARKK